MRHFLLLVVLCSLIFDRPAWAITEPVRPTEKKEKIDLWSTPYNEALRIERRAFNQRSSLEKIVGGTLAFALGTYGYYNDDNQQIAGKLIYSATQSGGILALSDGIIGLSSSSTVIALDNAFQKKGELTYSDYKRIVVQSRQASELGEIRKTAISTGLLAILYGYNTYKEGSGNQVLRNTFGFLAFNFTLFSGVSFYRWINFEEIAPTQPKIQIGASINSGSSVSIKYDF
jgi:hypothetical protein